MDERTRYEKGMEVRRAVLGNAHVDRALASRNDFTGDLQDLITRYAWGEIWARPGLPRHTRSLVTVAMLVALNRPEELRLHLAGAVRNGASREELKELLLHAAVYCGVPAAHAAFRIADEVLRAMEEIEPQGAKDPADR
jgi:4-carboxymuconolactone decarboxylase